MLEERLIIRYTDTKSNKEVLLRERKRHTDSGVASTRYVALVGGVPPAGGVSPPGPGKGVPPTWTWEGVPPPTWERGTPLPARWGTPPPPQMVYKVKI